MGHIVVLSLFFGVICDTKYNNSLICNIYCLNSTHFLTKKKKKVKISLLTDGRSCSHVWFYLNKYMLRVDCTVSTGPRGGLTYWKSWKLSLWPGYLCGPIIYEYSMTRKIGFVKFNFVVTVPKYNICIKDMCFQIKIANWLIYQRFKLKLSFLSLLYSAFRF